MAITDAYATAAEYRASLDKTDTSEDTEVLADLTSMTRYVERRTKQFFTKDAAAVVRVYQPQWGDVLDTDPIVSITTLKVDADLDGTYETTLTAGTDYELRPLNAGDGPEPAPYTQIRRVSGSWSTSSRVEVTGVFGWPAVPVAVKSAVIQLTAILRLEGNRGISQVTDLGTLISANPQARNMIDDLVLSYGLVTM